MITQDINFKTLKLKKNQIKLKIFINSLLEKKNEVLNSLSKDIKIAYNKKL